VTDIVLFHHAQGLTPGLQDVAELLERAGHTVHLPDAYDGHTFEDLDDGIAYAREVGFGVVQERSVRAVDQLPQELVYLGFSLGVMAAQQLAQTRPGARGAVLVSGCVPPSEFGTPWPSHVPVQIHSTADDPIFVGEGDIEAARALVAEADDAELFLYPGDAHLFADPSLSTYDGHAAAELTGNLLTFLSRVSPDADDDEE